MKYIHRFLEERILHTFERGKSVLLLGARQTGKTTLTNRFKHDLLISFVQPDVRQQYEKSPHFLKGEVEALTAAQAGKRPLVILDEVQKVPVILDVVQDLIDRGKANFILTGSSARKLRRGAQVNLLPGRVGGGPRIPPAAPGPKTARSNLSIEGQDEGSERLAAPRRA